MAYSAARITRPGNSGFTRAKYGSFAGKAATEAVAVKAGKEFVNIAVGKLM